MDLCGEIDKRARILAEDNIDSFIRDIRGVALNEDLSRINERFFHLLSAVMTIGASIVVERGGPDPVPGEIVDNKLLEELFITPHTAVGSTPRA